MDIKVIVKVILSALLLGCLLRMPYGYYQFVRLSVSAGLGVLAYYEYGKKHYIQVILCVGVALLFNPIKPI